MWLFLVSILFLAPMNLFAMKENYNPLEQSQVQRNKASPLRQNNPHIPVPYRAQRNTRVYQNIPSVQRRSSQVINTSFSSTPYESPYFLYCQRLEQEVQSLRAYIHELTLKLEEQKRQEEEVVQNHQDELIKWQKKIENVIEKKFTAQKCICEKRLKTEVEKQKKRQRRYNQELGKLKKSYRTLENETDEYKSRCDALQKNCSDLQKRIRSLEKEEKATPKNAAIIHTLTPGRYILEGGRWAKQEEATPKKNVLFPDSHSVKTSEQEPSENNWMEDEKLFSCPSDIEPFYNQIKHEPAAEQRRPTLDDLLGETSPCF